MTWRHLIAVTVALAVICAIAVWRLQGPQPAPATAPDRSFSAARAAAVLGGLLAEGVPHPVGSSANIVIRDRIVARFRTLGYEVAVQRAFVCNARPSCATVENIIAEPPGADDQLIFLAAHYDSVPAGPGASDDGTGVATLLEIARALQRNPTVAFLVTDGEEAGLLGAEAFVKDENWLRRMKAVVNVENRGTSGPSILFETSRNNAALVAAASRSIERPVSSSLFPAIYELLPNDTDLTVFKRVGKPAVNFAAIRGVEHYHQPTDDLAHVNLRTVQHHGDSALAITRELARGSSLNARQNAVFFDVLGLGVVRWPANWTLALIAISLIVILVRAPVKRPILHSLRRYSAGVGFFVAAPLLAGILGALVPMSWPRPTPWPSVAVAAMWALGIAAAFTAALLFRRFDTRDVFLGCAIAWHIVALAVATQIPGASYLFAFPAFVMSLCVAFRLPDTAASIAAAIVMFPLGLMLHTALGRVGFAPTAVLLALVGTTFAFAFADRRVAIGSSAIALLLAAAVFAGPRETRRTPPMDEIDAPRVEVTGTRNGNRLSVRIQSARAANVVTASFDPEVRVLSVNGVAPAPLNPRRRKRPPVVTVHGSEAAIELEASGPVSVNAADRVYGRAGAMTITRAQAKF